MSEGISFSRCIKDILRINYELEVVTGLLIRMPIHAQAFRIGGADIYPMVTKRKYVIDNNEVELEVPYIPGSSIRGRIRSLLELSLGLKLYSTDLKIWQHTRMVGDKEGVMSLDEFEEDVRRRCVIDELFGYPAINFTQLIEEYKKKLRGQISDEGKLEEEARRRAKEIFDKLSITRLIFSDAFPSNDYVTKLYKSSGGVVSISDFLEEKSENRIDRVTAAADPREIVRVRPGVIFSGTILILIFDHDVDVINEYLSTLVKGMKLLELTYLGGGGSRGYGRVRFRKINVNLIKLPDVTTVKELSYDNLDELSEEVKKLSELIKENISQ